MKIVFIGLTVSSSWGNGHATTYRGLLRELSALGHEIYFLEHDKPWYSSNRDFSSPEDFHLIFYESVYKLRQNFESLIRKTDMVIVGSYVPEGVSVCRWVLNIAEGVKAFYDIDTPVTLHKLDNDDDEYLSKDLVPLFDIYLSFSGGEVLQLLESTYGARKAKALYCSFDPGIYYPMDVEKKWLLGYLGTYSDDRQPTVDSLLAEASKKISDQKFVVAGPGYPEGMAWPANVERIDHLPPELHRKFYNEQIFTLNVTRQAMIRLGYSPSVRLFEAAACGVPIISDYWKGLTDLFEKDKEIFIARNNDEMMDILKYTTQEQRIQLGNAARQKVLLAHTAAHRARELVAYYEELASLEQY
ncbi:hypothetical protein C900_05408 [Fulvivirga imtechensis AK7]|uniref:Spore protein YkvP/CgeB glycosyl transferase-like domain-containing protein n=1 Tax=Fulvivirga imtechensis AK7 TaxID=1237149 RepID=L8JLK1_9BACT|nr:glycosyltransferase [Fulvivirga imtechensis]ELR69128.1 hypothetical protein C900_05408 [Fulvivirga imtechensis AK7]